MRCRRCRRAGFRNGPAQRRAAAEKSARLEDIENRKRCFLYEKDDELHTVPGEIDRGEVRADPRGLLRAAVSNHSPSLVTVVSAIQL